MRHDFKWKKEYSVQVKEIDQQHKGLIKIIRKLFKAIYQGLAKEKLGEILKELSNYADYHFSTEEKYFKKFNFKYSKEHTKEHHKFAKKINTLKKKYKNNELKISFELIDFLEDWLIEHILVSDKKYINFFKENGLK